MGYLWVGPLTSVKALGAYATATVGPDYCPSECFEALWDDGVENVTIFSVGYHMHEVGVKMRTDLVRGGVNLGELTESGRLSALEPGEQRASRQRLPW